MQLITQSMNKLRESRFIKITLTIALVFSVGSCSTSGGNGKQQTGTMVGAGLGALYKKDRKKGAAIGALVGGAVGNLIGRHLDEQERKLRLSMQRELTAGKVAISRPAESQAMVLSMTGNVLFETGKSEIRPSAYRQLNKLAQAWQPGREIAVIVTGHTDNIGQLVSNHDLSMKRAESVSTYLMKRGVPYEQMYIRGAGELSPIYSNESEGGREKNRRVDIVFFPADKEPPEVVPIVLADTEPKTLQVKKQSDKGSGMKYIPRQRDASSVYAFNESSRQKAQVRQQKVKQKEKVEPVSPIRPASEIIKHV